MKKITLKEYFDVLDEYKLGIVQEIEKVFSNEIQSFTYDGVRLIDARVGNDNCFIKLEIINYNGENKNYLVEVYKIKERIEHIIYIKKTLGAGIDFERNRVGDNTILSMIGLIESYQDYFNNPYNRKNMMSLFKLKKISDYVLNQIELDYERLPKFIENIEINKLRK